MIVAAFEDYKSIGKHLGLDSLARAMCSRKRMHRLDSGKTPIQHMHRQQAETRIIMKTEVNILPRSSVIYRCQEVPHLGD